MYTGKRPDGPGAPRPELFKMFMDSTELRELDEFSPFSCHEPSVKLDELSLGFREIREIRGKAATRASRSVAMSDITVFCHEFDELCSVH